MTQRLSLDTGRIIWIPIRRRSNRHRPTPRADRPAWNDAGHPWFFVLAENGKIPLKCKYAPNRRYACPLSDNRDVSPRTLHRPNSTVIFSTTSTINFVTPPPPQRSSRLMRGMCGLWSRGMPRGECCANHRSLLQRTRRDGTRCRHKSWGRVNRRSSKAFCPRTAVHAAWKLWRSRYQEGPLSFK
jgi:hypothetical protein